MKKLVILLLLVLVVSSLFADSYKARVSILSGAEVTTPTAAKLGYQLPDEPIPLTEGEEAERPTFTLYNSLPTPASVTVSVVNKPGTFTITLPSPQPIPIPIYPPHENDIYITYEATTVGNYTVTYLVVADTVSMGSSVHVELTFDVPVTVKPKPPVP